MPEKHLSIEEAINFQIWLDTNATRVDDTEGGWIVGEKKEPIILADETDSWRRLTGEADVYYPSGLDKKLSESGIIFDAEKAPSEKKDSSEMDEQTRRAINYHIELNAGW